MAFEVKFHPKALAELDEAINWYEKISFELAKDLFIKYQNSLARLKNNPKHFQELRRGYRKVSLKRFPYKIVFKEEAQNILVVVAFAHQKQRDYWKRR